VLYEGNVHDVAERGLDSALTESIPDERPRHRGGETDTTVRRRGFVADGRAGGHGRAAGVGPMTTVVLGWDGLDFDLVEAFELGDAFGPDYREIDTFDNPVLGKPHTYEVWPSIITGVHPDVHGVHAAVEGQGVSWDSDWIALAARLSRNVVPESLRTQVGRLLRSRGAELDFKRRDWYRERGVDTLFDGCQSRTITIPNYRDPRDDRLGLVYDRGADLADFLTIGGGGDTIHSPRVSVPELEERLVSETTKKLGVVRACHQREYDVLFAWLGYLDTVGHLAPVVDEVGWQERAYRLAATLTREIRAELTDEDTLVCVSDHGLQDGDHTHSAFMGSTDEDALTDVETVLDVRAGLERVTPASGAGESTVRDEFACASRVEARDAGEVRSQLEDLGYL